MVTAGQQAVCCLKSKLLVLGTSQIRAAKLSDQKMNISVDGKEIVESTSCWVAVCQTTSEHGKTICMGPVEHWVGSTTEQQENWK